MQGNPVGKPLSRLACMRHLSTTLLALALGAATAVTLASCGEGGDADLLPGNTAREITTNLDAVEQLANSGDCAGAQSAAQQVSDQIAGLGGVDRQLKQALRDGAERLNDVVASCAETVETIAPTTTPETTENMTTESSKKDKETEKDVKEEEKEEAKEEKAQPSTPTTPPTAPTTPTETTPIAPDTPPAPPAPPTGGGGTGAPGGVSPGSAAGENE